MPKKQTKETPEEQVERFRAHVERMIADGELDADEAERVLDAAVRSLKQNPDR